MNKLIRFFTVFCISAFLHFCIPALAQQKSLEQFESPSGWSFIKSDGVNLKLTAEPGHTGNSVRLDYDFTKGTGYGGIQKFFPIDLPENFEFTFYVKAESPANNFEIKFIDSTGNNVWWVNNRNYTFSSEWKKIRIKKRHIQFAWGPTEDQSLKRIDRIEFTIASFVGGKGMIWLDDLTFEPLPPEIQTYPAPKISASSSLGKFKPQWMSDNSDQTFWQSKGTKGQSIVIDFTTRREFGGIQINWLYGHEATAFEVFQSMDGKTWEKVYAVATNRDHQSFVNLPESEAKYLRLDLKKGNNDKGFGITEIRFPEVRNSLTLNDFLIYTAKNSPRGNYPRYFLEQASYWTITGVNNDLRESLINEEGMVEVDKARFSIEPMIRIGDSLWNWSNIHPEQSLGSQGNGDFSFIPTVTWHSGPVLFKTEVLSAGESNQNSNLYIRYSVENNSENTVTLDLFLLIRPFQVNPWYQFLNLTGGVGKIGSIKEVEPGIIAVDDKIIFSQMPYDQFGVSGFDEGNLVEMIRSNLIPEHKSKVDPSGLANGIMKYTIRLNPGEKKLFYVVVPYYDNNPSLAKQAIENADREFTQAAGFWKEKVSHIRFDLPESANRIMSAYKANLVYILINRDNAGIQPGSRSYERSWIRDGALTSSALLKSGIVPEVKRFIAWYAEHQYENGKVPCVVDFRGPDPVPENDSHGQLIYVIREYFNFTHDTAFLKEMNPHVVKAVDYIEELVARRSTDHYRYGNDSVRAQYGLVPESISHEGYSAKPMHSYWDNFFIMKGLKDAVEIQRILGEKEQYERIAKIRDTFRTNLYNSLQLAMKFHGIDYIPGCAELGDFDATSTTIALTPCNELINLPKPQVNNTFDKYYEFFKNRRDGKLDWVNYTPYENRLIGSFIILDQPDRAHELIDYFLNDQRPHGWSHWAEVVWKDYRTPRFIGDMPHTWVGSDFINAIRSMFVYENEYDQSLVLASALYQEWIDAPNGMSVQNLPTYYGEISYSIKKDGTKYLFSITGDLDLPANGMKIKNFNGGKMPKKVRVNGKEIGEFNNREIIVRQIPVELEIIY